MDQPYCEICGEQHATLKMEDAAVCDDCFASECREALEPVLGKRCCTVYCQDVTDEPAICLAVYGKEHTHGERHSEWANTTRDEAKALVQSFRANCV